MLGRLYVYQAFSLPIGVVGVICETYFIQLDTLLDKGSHMHKRSNQELNEAAGMGFGGLLGAGAGAAAGNYASQPAVNNLDDMAQFFSGLVNPNAGLPNRASSFMSDMGHKLGPGKNIIKELAMLLRGPKAPKAMLLGGLGAGALAGGMMGHSLAKQSNMDGMNAPATYATGEGNSSVPVIGPQTASVGVGGIGGALDDLGGPLLGKSAAARFNKMSKQAQARVLAHPATSFPVKLALVKQASMSKEAKIKIATHLYSQLSLQEKRAFLGSLARMGSKLAPKALRFPERRTNSR